MKEQQDYIRDISEMRSMMEKSSRFKSLSGLAGILAGLYALAGTWIVYKLPGFNDENINYSNGTMNLSSPWVTNVIILGISVFLLAFSTAFFLSYRRAQLRKEKFWNPTSRRLLINMAVPFFAGAVLILILLSRGLIGLMIPCALIFYGLALYNGSNFTYEEVKTLGLVEIVLGLFSAYFVQYGLLCFALGFGIFNMIYGIYMHYRYER